MAGISTFAKWFRREQQRHADAHATDAELLSRFCQSQDAAAFELLVWRHANMVWNVALRILRQSHDADDAFQATFLILARQAHRIKKGNLAPWLHRVTQRVAYRLTKRRRDQPLTDDVPVSMDSQSLDAETQSALDTAIDRLPERFRQAVILCYLLGKTTEEAAQLLGCPKGTILSRLATARTRLAAQLQRQGLTAPTLATGSLLLSQASISTAKVQQTTQVVFGFLQGSGAKVLVSFQLANEVITMGIRQQVATWATAMFLTAGVTSGTAMMVVAAGDEPGQTPVQKVVEGKTNSEPPTPAGDDKPVAANEAKEKIDRIRFEKLEKFKTSLYDTLAVLKKHKADLNRATANLQDVRFTEEHELQTYKALSKTVSELEVELITSKVRLAGFKDANESIEKARRTILALTSEMEKSRDTFIKRSLERAQLNQRLEEIKEIDRQIERLEKQLDKLSEVELELKLKKILDE